MTEHRRDTDATRFVTDESLEPVLIPDAAARLGLSIDAVRMRIRRGTLSTKEIHGKKHVLVPRLVTDATRRDINESRVDTDETPTQRDESVPASSGADTMPGRSTSDQELINTLHATVADLRARLDAEQEARRMTDARVEELENGLLRVAGNLSSQGRELPATVIDVPQERADASHDAQDGPQHIDPPQMTNETLRGRHIVPVPAEVQLAVGWRRWWRRVMGHEG